MNKKTIAFLAVLMVIAANIFAGDNLIKNGDFKVYTPQLKPIVWTLGWAKPSGVWNVDTEVYVSAPASLKITNQAGQDTIVAQVISLEPDTDYHFSCRMKGENVVEEGKPGSGARIYIQDGPQSFRSGSSAGMFQSSIGTFDWGVFEFNFNSRDVKTGKMTIYLSLRNASGTVWYDDVVLEKVEIQQDAGIGGKRN